MADVTRKKAITIELWVLILWAVVPRAFREFFLGTDTRTIHDMPTAVYDILFLIGEIAVVAFILWNSGDRWDSFGVRKLRPARDIPLGLAIGILLFGAVEWPMYRVFRWLQAEGLPGPLATTREVAGLTLAYAAVNCCFHELLYRGAFVTRIEELTANRWWGVVLAALMVGLMSAGGGLPLALTYFGGGLLCGIAYVLTGSLWPALIGQFCAYLIRSYFFHHFF